MQRALRLLALILGVASALTPLPALADRTDPLGGSGGGPIAGFVQVRVVHAGTGDAFPGAFVMVGPRAGTPFAGNWGFTSDTGEIGFSDPSLQGSIQVTAGAPGHAYFTMVAVNAHDLVLPLRQIASTQPIYPVGDYVSGIDVDNGMFHAGDGNVDMAFVMPALKLENLMSFEAASLMGPPEIISIFGQDFAVPSNVFIPQQWELFVEIRKDHYYLYLNPGSYTLSAMSGRVPLDALLNAGSIMEVIALTQWREIDIRDVTITGDTNDADLAVDPDLSPTVTLNLANLPESSVAWCFSIGDLDNRAGLGRLIPLGLNSFSCPGGAGPCSGVVDLTTTPATGEFTGMTYFPGVAVDLNDTEDALVILARAPHAQSYTENMSSFFQLLDLVYDTGSFSWNDVENPATGSPPVDLSMARIVSTDTTTVYWEFMIPGDVHGFETPGLPVQAPPGPQIGTPYRWEHVSLGLGYDLPSFDFNDFAFSDILAHGSHLATDKLDVTFQGDPARVSDDAQAMAKRTVTGRPNPFHEETTVRFEIAEQALVDLSIYTLDGRKVTTLESRRLPPGSHQVTWLGTDTHGARLPQGVYLARLVAPKLCRTWKLVLR